MMRYDSFEVSVNRLGHQRGMGLSVVGLWSSWHLPVCGERSVSGQGTLKRHRGVIVVKGSILWVVRFQSLVGVVGTLRKMLEDLRDFKAVKRRTELKQDLGAGEKSVGRGLQKKHSEVILTMAF